MESTTTAERLNLLPVRLAPSICYSSPTKDGCIVLDIEKGRILSLNDVGASLFEKIASKETGIMRAELVDISAQLYSNSDRHQLELQVDDFIHQLEEKGIIEVKQINEDNISNATIRIFEKIMISITRYICISLLKTKSYVMASLVLLALIDGILKLVSFKSLHRTIINWPIRGNTKSIDIAKAVAAVERACIWYPRQALCMQRSATSTCLLRCLGIPALLVIGIRKMPFYGHAWVEVDNNVVNDHKNVQIFYQALTRC